jgi:hypothetical protein
VLAPLVDRLSMAFREFQPPRSLILVAGGCEEWVCAEWVGVVGVVSGWLRVVVGGGCWSCWRWG